MPVRPPRSAAACAALATLLLAACTTTTGRGPSTLPPLPPSTASATPTSSPSATVAPPVRPANADDYTAEGMKSFTRYAIKTFNYVYTTGDVKNLEPISDAHCKICSSVSRNLSRVWGSGGKTVGSQIKALDLSTPGTLEGVMPSVAAIIVESPYMELSKTGKVVRSTKQQPQQEVVFDLVRKGDRWLLGGVRGT